MSAEYKDGGPAFPLGCYDLGLGRSTLPVRGMSLRDWLAGQALAGGAIVGAPADTARKCFAIADAMLAERRKP